MKNFENRIAAKDILVIGDVMLDIYCSGEIKRISPEAPVPVFKKLSERCALGGAGNVAENLCAADQRVSLLTVIGDDPDGDAVMRQLDRSSIGSDFVLRSKSRRTTAKTRFLASNHQVFRMDLEDTESLPEEEYALLLSKLKECVGQFDMVVLSDYMKGLLSLSFTRQVIDIANRAGVRVLVDVKDINHQKYAGAFLLKPNLQELESLTGKKARTYQEIAAVSVELCRACECEYVLTTCGERGMVLTDRSGEYEVVQSVPVEVFDVTGAGDTVIAYLAACLANGFTMVDAVSRSNIAAGIQVSKAGASPVYLNEVSAWMQKNDRDGAGKFKIVDRETLRTLRERNPGKKIVFTNGCYDILHLGHVQFLRKAAAFGDILVVAVNSDASVRRLKGDSRPVNGQDDRTQLLAALEFVDYVTIFDEDTPYELISELIPDVLVKGADYAPDEVVGREIVEQNGGRLELIALVEGRSTSAIIEKISLNGG
jgi:D-beta-D-heptose 7-phosphate kinase/D-beta-D-heptose 1-phosphate adenosyltransferase